LSPFVSYGPLHVCCPLKPSEPDFDAMENVEFRYQNATFHALKNVRQIKNLTGRTWDELQEEDEMNTLGQPLGPDDFAYARTVGEFSCLNFVEFQ
jgi:hypothetical protein